MRRKSDPVPCFWMITTWVSGIPWFLPPISSSRDARQAGFLHVFTSNLLEMDPTSDPLTMVEVKSTASILKPGWWFGCHFLFSHIIGNFIIPIDELIFFRGVRSGPPTRKRLFHRCSWVWFFGHHRWCHRKLHSLWAQATSELQRIVLEWAKGWMGWSAIRWEWVSHGEKTMDNDGWEWMILNDDILDDLWWWWTIMDDSGW